MWVRTEAMVRCDGGLPKTVASAGGPGTEVAVGQQGLKTDAVRESKDKLELMSTISTCICVAVSTVDVGDLQKQPVPFVKVAHVPGPGPGGAGAPRPR